ncbi:hypothetical protein PRIPAC_77006, partial [Pristionchus pacificus]|uniref:G protein-coupled receptor n=1 Tax=Pristionchus pacificus TaxID=54126 RepID=A0A2A6CQR0_PRIPA
GPKMVLDESWREHTAKYGHAGVRPVHLAAFGLAIVNFALNGLIWYASHARSKMINKSRLHLFYALAVTNCLTGLFSVPTFINLFAHNNINCPKWTIIVGSAFEMGLDRMRAILALAIALERLFAIIRPRSFFLTDHRKNAHRICAFGFTWSVADALFMIFEDGLSPVLNSIRTHCVSTSSSGPLFHAYFLILNLVDGFALLLVYILFLAKFLSIRKSLPEPPCDGSIRSPRARSMSIRRKGMKDVVGQANSLTLTVIFCVIVFSVLPSSLYGYDMIMHKVIFMDLGPVVTIGYHLHGITSSFCYNYKHREIRRALDKVYPCRRRMCFPASQQSSSEGRRATMESKPPHPTATTTNAGVGERRPLLAEGRRATFSHTDSRVSVVVRTSPMAVKTDVVVVSESEDVML